MDESDPSTKVGYGRPPKETQFQKGRSGNPRGRPKGITEKGVLERVLSQKVTVRENGVEKQYTMAEAFLLKLMQDGLKGDAQALKQSLAAIEYCRANPGRHPRTQCVIILVQPGNPNKELVPLRMARKLDRFRDTARTVIEPWLVQMALGRFGAKRLTPEEQAKVIKATRTPRKVKWPDWWTVIS